MIHKRLLVAVVLLAASGVLAQTANVIELSPVDAARAQKAWDTLQKAQTDWDTVKTFVSDKYVTGQTIAPHGYGVPDWANGFEFSKDFKVIVPKLSSGTTGIIATGCPTYNYPYWNVPSCGVISCNLKYQ